MTTPESAPPQLSPDGHWWWDGTEWTPASEAARAQATVQEQAVPEQQVQEQAVPEPAQQVVPYGSVLPAQVPGGGGSGRGRLLGALAAVLVAGVAAGAFLFLSGGDEAPVAAPRPTATTQPKTDPKSLINKALIMAANAQEAYFVDEGGYTPRLKDLEAGGYVPTPGVRITILSATKTRYCMKAASSGWALFYASDGGGVTKHCA
jgi:hypothetical protein